MILNRVEVLVSWISSVCPLELVDPLDVLSLELVPVDFESLECLDINWSVKIKVIILFSSNKLLLIFGIVLVVVLVKNLLEFL